MAYFRDDEARGIIRDTYAGIRLEDAAVARALYPEDALAGIPAAAVVQSLGVGHPVRHAALRPGEVVLDLGCGGGIDTLLAARQVGPTGRVVGLDMTLEMVERARRNARNAGF